MPNQKSMPLLTELAKILGSGLFGEIGTVLEAQAEYGTSLKGHITWVISFHQAEWRWLNRETRPGKSKTQHAMSRVCLQNESPNHSLSRTLAPGPSSLPAVPSTGHSNPVKSAGSSRTDSSTQS